MTQSQQRWVDDFINHLALERSLSKHTCSNYRRDLTYATQYCDAQDIASWDNFGSGDVQALVSQRHRQGISGRSLQRLLSTLRSFYQFLMREHRVKRNPAQGIRPPRSADRLPETLDVDQATRLMQIPTDTPLGMRDRAIVELFYSSALRLSELTGLNLIDLDLNDATLRVRGKGSKERIVPVGRLAISALNDWIQIRDRWCAPEQTAIFVTQKGKRISPRSVQARLKHWSQVLGLDTPVHPHQLRHSCATHILESSADLRAVQELLGHANLSTTQVYTHLDFQHLAEVYDQSHPRARKK